MAHTEYTRKKHFTLSGNECAVLNCTNPIFDTDHDVMVGEICHIKARSENGPRYDPNQTPEERDGYDNLILMCGAHNKIIDDPTSVGAFTVELLREYKKQHAERFKNTVVRPHLLNYWMDLHARHEVEWPRFRSVPGFPLDVNFQGRVKKRRELTEWLTGHGQHGAKPILQLWGIGGIGKSNLSWLWAKHDVSREEVPLERIQLEMSGDAMQQIEVIPSEPRTKNSRKWIEC